MKIIIDKISNFFIEGLEYKTPQQCLAVKNGVEILLLNLPKTVLLFLIAYWLNMLLPVIVCMCAYGALRMYSFGIHLSHDMSCAIWGFLIYIGGTHLALHINISNVVRIVIYVICFFLFLKYAPAGMKPRPIGAKQYIPLKAMTMLILMILIAVSTVLQIFHKTIYANIILIAMVSQVINVLPFTYKIFRKEWIECLKD